MPSAPVLFRSNAFHAHLIGAHPHFACFGSRRSFPQEVEDGHSEEVSALREAMDELRLQLKTAKSQANETSCIAQVWSC